MDIKEAVSLVYTVVGNGRYLRTKEHNSLVLDTYRNLYYWNSLGEGGDVADFLVRHVGMSKNAAKLLQPPQTHETYKKRSLLNIDFVMRANATGKRDFWYKRGFNDAVIDLYLLGQIGDMYVIPFFMQGNLTAITMRSEDKFITEISGSTLSLFGYDVLDSKKVFFVESPLDVPLLRRFGFNAVSHNYGGNVWDKKWTGLLSAFDVIFVPDNDSAGEASLKKVVLSCRVVQWPKTAPRGFDIGKLYHANPDAFVNNVLYLEQHAVPIDFIRGFTHNVYN